MTRPVVSDAAERIYESMRAYQDGDDQEWGLLIWCAALAGVFDRSNEWLRHDDIGSGRRRAMDPDRCPAWVLPYLAARAGVRVPPGYTEAQTRQIIKERPARRIGNDAYIVAAVTPFLTGTRYVHIINNHGAAGVTTVSTLTAETPNPDAANAAIQAAVAHWVQATHAVITGGTYTDLRSTHASYTEVKTDFADYLAVLSDPSHT